MLVLIIIRSSTPVVEQKSEKVDELSKPTVSATPRTEYSKDRLRKTNVKPAGSYIRNLDNLFQSPTP